MEVEYHSYLDPLLERIKAKLQQRDEIDEQLLVEEILPFEDFTEDDVIDALLILETNGVVESNRTPRGGTAVKLIQ